MAAAVVFAAALACGSALAHDSWLAPGRDAAVPHLFELGTGNRYPKMEFNPTTGNFAQGECLDGAGRRSAFQPGRELADRMEMRSGAPLSSPPPLSCWVELKALDIEIDPAIVRLYLDEVHAPAEVRQTWSALQSRGFPWRETYRKFARIEAGGAQATPQARAMVRQGVGAGLEILLLGDAAVAVARPMEFQVLRDGRPLAGLAVELISERNRLGVWRESDAQGRVQVTLPFGGRWLLRATELRHEPPDRWSSRFVTLAIEAP